MTDAAPAAAPAAPVADANPNAAPDPGAQPAPAPERRRVALHELADDDEVIGIVDGQERAWKVAEARRRLQTEDASTRRFQEAKKVEAAARMREERLARTLGNPAMLAEEFRRAGMSPTEFARAMLEAQAAEEAMTPEQRKLREYEMKEREWREQQEHAQRQHTQQLVQQNAQVYERAFNDAANLAGVPDSPRVRRAVTEALVDAVREAIGTNRALDQSALVRVARTAYEEHAQDYRRDLPEDLLMERLTPELIQKWNQKRASQKQAPLTPVQPVVKPRDDSGRFAPQTRATNVDASGRPIIRDAFEAMAEIRRQRGG
jgi:hypothetical protein